MEERCYSMMWYRAEGRSVGDGFCGQPVVKEAFSLATSKAACCSVNSGVQSGISLLLPRRRAAKYRGFSPGTSLPTHERCGWARDRWRLTFRAGFFSVLRGPKNPASRPTACFQRACVRPRRHGREWATPDDQDQRTLPAYGLDISRGVRRTRNHPPGWQ